MVAAAAGVFRVVVVVVVVLLASRQCARRCCARGCGSKGTVVCGFWPFVVRCDCAAPGMHVRSGRDPSGACQCCV